MNVTQYCKVLKCSSDSWVKEYSELERRQLMAAIDDDFWVNWYDYRCTWFKHHMAVPG